MADDRYAAALALVKGYQGIDATLGNGPLAEFAPEFDRLKDELVWGVVWSDHTLDVRTRSLCTIAALTVLGSEEQLSNHIAWALNVGVSKAEVIALVVKMTIYGGMPVAHSAMRVANKVFADHNLL